MSNEKKTTETQSSFSSIKNLSAIVQGENYLPTLLKNAKNVRRLIESVLKDVREIEKRRARAAEYEMELERQRLQGEQEYFDYDGQTEEEEPFEEETPAVFTPEAEVMSPPPADAPAVAVVSQEMPEEPEKEAVAETRPTAEPVKAAHTEKPKTAQAEKPKTAQAEKAKMPPKTSPQAEAASKEEKPKYPPKRMYDPTQAIPSGPVQTAPGVSFRSRTFNPDQGTRPPYQPRQPRRDGAPGTGFAPRTDRPFTPGQQQRPPYGPRTGTGRPSVTPSIPLSALKSTKPFDPSKKKDTPGKGEEKKTMNKRTLIRKGFLPTDTDDERMGTRKLKNKKAKDQESFVAPKVEKAIITSENITVKMLSEKIGKPATEIIKQLMILGTLTTINSVVDFPTMELVASELGVSIELKLDKTKEEVLEEIHDDSDEIELLEKRPPIITVMGHVDHGKTTLLDAIRKTNVAGDEAGGITQAIGAYTIMLRGEKLTFIDTPGHEAFTAMRARGAKVTDIAILVVAADDGVMPQTVEAINHAKAANVPLIVAINKMDKPNASPDKIMQRLTEHDILSEEWGGSTIMVPISAKTGMNIDKLLSNVLIQAEIMELKANASRKAKGSIIEARLDKGKGPVATIIVQNGTLRVGDMAVSGTSYGRIRAMLDDKGRSVKEAGPSTAVLVQGFNEVPNAGDLLMVVDDEKLAKQVAAERSDKIRADFMDLGPGMSIDDVFTKISEDSVKPYNIIVKADSQGSVEALKASLHKLTNEEVRVNTIHGGVGAINKSDIMLAEASNALIIGFNVRADNDTKNLADDAGIAIKLYRIIYEAIEDIELAMKGMLTPKFREQIIGHAEVRNVFNLSSQGVIAGLYVTKGKILRNAKIRVIRENIVLYEGDITTLKRFKDDVKEVNSGYECGLQISGFQAFKEADQIEVFSLERIPV